MSERSKEAQWGAFGRSRRRIRAVSTVGLVCVVGLLVSYELWVLTHAGVWRWTYIVSLAGTIVSMFVWMGMMGVHRQARCPWCCGRFYPRLAVAAPFVRRCTSCGVELPPKLR